MFKQKILGNVTKLGMTAYGNRLECVIQAHLSLGNRLLRSRKGFGAQRSMLWCAPNPPAVRSDETMNCDKMAHMRNANGYEQPLWKRLASCSAIHQLGCAHGKTAMH